MNSEHITIMVVLFTFFLTTGYVLTAIASAISRTRRDKNRNEALGKLLDRFNSSAEVVSFLQTDAGRRLLEGADEGRPGFVGRVLNTMQAGIVLLTGGIGMTIVSNNTGSVEAARGLQVFGGIVIAVGLGLAVSSAWSYSLLKRWGLFATKPEQR